MIRLLAGLACVLASQSFATEPGLYFMETSKAALHAPVTADNPVAFTTRSAITLNLELRTQSVDERNKFQDLCIDDYRYDEPNYFADKRVPNVSFEITKEENGVYKPVPLRLYSQGGGADMQYLRTDVNFEIGGDPAKLKSAYEKLEKDMAANPISKDEKIKRIKAIIHQFDVNQPGKYRISATYCPKVAGKWTGKITTAPIYIVISEVG